MYPFVARSDSLLPAIIDKPAIIDNDFEFLWKLLHEVDQLTFFEYLYNELTYYAQWLTLCNVYGLTTAGKVAIVVAFEN